MIKLISALLLLVSSVSVASITERDRADLANNRNLIVNGGCESGIAGWKTYLNTAQATPVTGAGGSPTVTISTTTTNPLSGNASCLLTKTAVNSQGQGWAYDFTIDREMQAKVLQISFTYEVNSGTFQAGSDSQDSDVEAYIYDVTNGVIIQPAPYKLTVGSGQQGRFQGQFQTSASGTSYRLILHEPLTGTSAFSLKVDSVSVSQVIRIFGAPVTDWAAYTPTITGMGTVSNVAFRYMRIGSNLKVIGRYTAGTVAASSATITLPSGLSVDSGIGSGAKLVGRWTTDSTTANNYKDFAIIADSTSGNTLGMSVIEYAASLSALSTQNGNAMIASSLNCAVEFEVPISGWSSSVVMSNDASTSVVAAQLYATSVANAATYNFGAATVDTNGAWNGSTTYTCPVSGVYRVSAQMQFTVTASAGNYYNIQLSKNGSAYALQTKKATGTATGTDQFIFSPVLVKCNAGDTLTLGSPGTSYAAVTSSTDPSWMTIERLSGPASIAASESVGAFYNGTPTGTLTSSFNAATYGTKVKDSHGAMSGNTWTSPVSGSFSIAASADVAGTFSAANRTLIEIWVNGAAVSRGGGFAGSASTSNMIAHTAIESYPILAGQTVQVKVFTEATTPTYNASGGNFFSIAKVGN